MRTGKIKLYLFLLLLTPLILAGCYKSSDWRHGSKMNDVKAVAELKPTVGNQVTGVVTFTPRDGAVMVVAEARGLKPGKHGFHIHEKGDCSASDATSAGGHYNPNNTQHGGPDSSAENRHVGDLGNLLATVGGSADYERLDHVISLDGSHSIIGKSVIIHSGEDDLSSQPTGGAGSRLACGVIERVK